jgi:putative DNA primase/helicase
MMGELHEAALGYAAQGAHVLPLHYPTTHNGALMCSCGNRQCANPGKHPYPRLAPKGLLNATVDTILINRWWDAGTPYNIGIRTGKVSGIVVIDVDPRHGGDESLAQLEAEHGDLPPTWRVITGAGGQHIYFQHPGGTVPNSAGKLGSGIDLRGDGGYVLAPPSRHICGRGYAFSVDHHPDDVPLAPTPDWLVTFVRAPARNGTATMPATWRKLVADGVAEGCRNDAVARLAGHLLRRDIDARVTLDLVRCWNQTRCRPPLSEDELSSIVRSIAARELQRRRAGGHDV